MKKGIITLGASAAGLLVGAVFGAGVAGNAVNEKAVKQKENSDKYFALYMLMNQWVKVKQTGKSVSAFLAEKGYRKVAIYGMAYVGETLYSELRNSEITVSYAIDRNADTIYSEIDVMSPDDTLEKVDAIIVTSIYYFDEIKEALKDKVTADIISLEDIIFEL